MFSSTTVSPGVGAAMKVKLGTTGKTNTPRSPSISKSTPSQSKDRRVLGINEGALYKLLASPQRAAILRNPVIESLYFAKTRYIHPDDVVINSSGLDIHPEILKIRMEQGRRRMSTPPPKKSNLRPSLNKSLPATPSSRNGTSDNGSSDVKTASSLGSYKGDVIEIGTARVAYVVKASDIKVIDIPPRRYTGPNAVTRPCRIPTPTKNVSGQSQSPGQLDKKPLHDDTPTIRGRRGNGAHTNRGSSALSEVARRRVAKYKARSQSKQDEAGNMEIPVDGSMNGASRFGRGSNLTAKGQELKKNHSKYDMCSDLDQDQSLSMEDEDKSRRGREYGLGGALKISQEATMLLGKPTGQGNPKVPKTRKNNQASMTSLTTEQFSRPGEPALGGSSQSRSPFPPRTSSLPTSPASPSMIPGPIKQTVAQNKSRTNLITRFMQPTSSSARRTSTPAPSVGRQQSSVRKVSDSSSSHRASSESLVKSTRTFSHLKKVSRGLFKGRASMSALKVTTRSDSDEEQLHSMTTSQHGQSPAVFERLQAKALPHIAQLIVTPSNAAVRYEVANVDTLHPSERYVKVPGQKHNIDLEADFGDNDLSDDTLSPSETNRQKRISKIAARMSAGDRKAMEMLAKSKSTMSAAYGNIRAKDADEDSLISMSSTYPDAAQTSQTESDADSTAAQCGSDFHDADSTYVNEWAPSNGSNLDSNLPKLIAEAQEALSADTRQLRNGNDAAEGYTNAADHTVQGFDEIEVTFSTPYYIDPAFDEFFNSLEIDEDQSTSNGANVPAQNRSIKGSETPIGRGTGEFALNDDMSLKAVGESSGTVGDNLTSRMIPVAQYGASETRSDIASESKLVQHPCDASNEVGIQGADSTQTRGSGHVQPVTQTQVLPIPDLALAQAQAQHHVPAYLVPTINANDNPMVHDIDQALQVSTEVLNDFIHQTANIYDPAQRAKMRSLVHGYGCSIAQLRDAYAAAIAKINALRHEAVDLAKMGVDALQALESG